ncbi:hypothetical protein ES703_06451 [subsurface metagenome]
MNILRRLIKQKGQENQIVWGIRVPRKVKIQWQILAAMMRVPTNRLILYVLKDWIQQNANVLTDDVSRNRLAQRITELHLNSKLD